MRHPLDTAQVRCPVTARVHRYLLHQVRPAPRDADAALHLELMSEHLANSLRRMVAPVKFRGWVAPSPDGSIRHPVNSIGVAILRSCSPRW